MLGRIFIKLFFFNVNISSVIYLIEMIFIYVLAGHHIQQD